MVAADGDQSIVQFVHRAWTAKDGAPNGIRPMAQTPDGYLWLGTRNGLYRFDGVSFARYEPPQGAPFPSNRILALSGLPDGSLWMGLGTGAIGVLRNGMLTIYTKRDGLTEGSTIDFAMDREGTVWAAMTGGLLRLEGNRWKLVGKDWSFPGEYPEAIFVDHRGTLWVATGETIVYLPRGYKAFQSTGIKVGLIWRFAEDFNGKLWMAETGRSVRPVPLHDGLQPPDDTEIQVGSVAMAFDQQGALWVTSLGDGIRRADAPESLRGKIGRTSSAVKSFTARDGLTDDASNSIFRDREGNIWVSSETGLDCFRRGVFVQSDVPKIFSQGLFSAVDGDLWVTVSANGRAARISEGRVHESEIIGSAHCSCRGPTGTVWVPGYLDIVWLANGRFRRFPYPAEFPIPFTRLIFAAEDRSGTLWLAAEGEGIYRRNRGMWMKFEVPSDMAQLQPLASLTEGSGRVWFGYGGGAIVAIDEGKVKIFSSSGESPVGSVRIFQERKQRIWIGGERGLAVLDGGRFRAVLPEDLPAFGGVSGIETAADGSLWMAESRGVVHIAAPDVQEALQNPSFRVPYRLFNSLDGLPGNFPFGPCSREVQAADGRLWFLTSGGLAWLNPQKSILRNPLPPPVQVLSVAANSQTYSTSTDVVLPPRTTSLQISYTATSLAVPERVRFRYRLEGVDRDWQDAGTRREAFYTRLGPDKYHFRVIASNNDGVWNETGATLDFSVLPAWYQTIWFRSLCVAAFLALLWAFYQFRLYQLQRQFNVALEARVNERTRIARELHDTLLQSLHGLLFRVQAAKNLFPRRPEEAMETLDGVIARTEQAIAESQDAITDLRPGPTASSDLGGLLMATGKELETSANTNGTPLTFGLIVEGERQTLSPFLQEEIYRIARELLRNAFRHACAHHIEAEVRYDDEQLRVRIRDDGKGMDPEVLKIGRRQGHWGLPGVKERAQQIGAQLDFWSEAGAGTEVQLSIPAKIAYKDPRDRPRDREQ